MSIALAELTQAYTALADLDVRDEDLDAALGQINDAIDLKAENIAKLVYSLETEADGYKIMAKRLSDAAQARTNRVSSLKAYLLANLQAVGLKRAGGLLYFTVQASSPSGKVIDEGAVPDDLKEQVVSWKVNMREAITRWKETGQAPAGFEVTQGTHLVLRP